MFGQSNNPNTPFGGGFGQPPTNTAPVFGSPNPGQPQPGGGLFSSPPPVFGQQQQQQPTNAFGAPTTTAFGGVGFGSQQPATNTGQPGLFGAPAPAPTGFGGAFGAPAPTNAFGSTSGGGGLFGSSTVGGGFGQPAPTGGGLFGQAPAPTFGAAPAPAFGAPASIPTFGAPSTSLFGSAPAPATAFGAPSPTAFGAPTSFGAPAPSVFGAPAPAPTTSFFGSPPAPAPFGAPAPIGGLFGSTPAPATTGFGGTTSLFGSTPAPTFGSPPAPNTGFGASGGLFNTTTTGTSTVGGGGTRIAPYQVTSRQDGNVNINLQSISAMDAYKDQSHEELRFADYSQGNRGTASPAPASFGGFGAPAPAPVGVGLFGSTPAPTSAFGSTGGGLFGSTPAPAFGAAPAPLGGFGQTTGSSLFGQSAPAPSTAFGAPAPAFGSPAPAPSGLFGAPAPTGLFGSTPAPAPFGAPAPSGLFGSAPAPSTGFGSSLFGSTPAPTSIFGAPASGGLFGAPAPTTGGLFGSPAPAAPFGQASSFGAPTQSLFGATPAPAFGAPSAGFFGQSNPQQQQQFQQQMQPLQVQTVFSAPIVAPNVSEVLEQQMRALNNQLEENKKFEVWRGPRAPTSPATTPTNNLNNNESYFFSRSANSGTERLTLKTPSSSAQIRPRSFAQQEPSKSVASTLLSGRDNSSLMSPEAFARSSQLNLVVRPDSLRRLNKLNLHRLTHETTCAPTIPEPVIDPVPTEAAVDHAPLNNGGETQSNKKDSIDVSENTKTVQHVEAPAKSPGYEYYQHVIGTSRMNKNVPITPVAKGPANGSHSLIPKLSKTGYEVSPTLEEMLSMSEADLASVRNFTVSRPGYGKVEWEGSVDVRGANLDEIVVIETKDVSVYSSDEENGTKPEEGTKLNRPALITFEGIFPKEGAYADEEVKNKFTLKLKKAVLNMNAEMVAYDSTNGIWKIRVRHFSRYAFIEDEDSDNEEVLHNEGVQEMTETPRPTKLETRKATPYAAREVPIVEMSDNDQGTYPNEFMATNADPFDMDIRQDAEDAAAAIRVKLQETHAMAMSEIDNQMDVEHDLDDEQIVQHEENDPLYEQFDESELLLAQENAKNCDIFSEFTSKNVCISRMNQSFRVGWLPNGSFIKMAVPSNKSMPALLISRPMLSDQKSDTASAVLLQSQQENAIALSSGVDDCPHYSLKTDAGILGTTMSVSDELKHVFLLLTRLLPSSHMEANATLNGETVPLGARNIAGVSKFLLDLCSSDDSNAKSKKWDSDVVDEIYVAYSIGNLELACELATNAGYTALAALLACGPAYQSDVAMLFNEISQTKELKHAISPTLNRILENMSGHCKLDIDAFRRGEKTQDWRRRLALHIRRRKGDNLLEVLNEYEASVRAHEAPYPFPSYLSGSPSSAKIKSISYRVLQLYSDPTSMRICEAVDPSGYTPHVHDYSLPFHLVVAMMSVPDHSFEFSQYEAEYIKDGYATQLVMQGYWERAVFVLLCSIGDSDFSCATFGKSVMKGSQQVRSEYYTRQAKNLILKFYDERCDPLAQSRRNYLTTKVRIPSFWFDEATCYRSALLAGDLTKAVDSMYEFDVDLWRDAFVSFMWPKHMLQRNDSEAEEFLGSLDAAVLGAAPNSLALALFRYVVLEKQYMTYRKKVLDNATAGEDDDGQCTDSVEYKELQDEMDYLLDTFTMLSTTATSSLSSSLQLLPNLYFLPNLSRTIPLPVIISEILGNVKQWKKEFHML